MIEFAVGDQVRVLENAPRHLETYRGLVGKVISVSDLIIPISGYKQVYIKFDKRAPYWILSGYVTLVKKVSSQQERKVEVTSNSVTVKCDYQIKGDLVMIYMGDKPLTECLSVISDSTTKKVLAYRTTSGEIYQSLTEAIQRQIVISVNSTPLDSLMIVWRTFKDYPFYSTTGLNTQDRLKTVYKLSEMVKPIVYVLYDYKDKKETIANRSPKTVMVVDKMKDTVYLIPAGQTIVVEDR